MAETNNTLIVQAWIKSTIFSVQIWSHFFIFCRITLNPTAFTEIVYCLSVKASPSPENYSRTPRDYPRRTRSASKTQRTAQPLRAAMPVSDTRGRCWAGVPLCPGLVGSRSSLPVPSFGQQGYTAAILVHSQIFSNCFLKLWQWLGLRAFLPQPAAVCSGSSPSCLLFCNSAYTVYIFLKDIN